MYDDEEWDEDFEEEDTADDPTEKLIRRLRNNHELSDEEEGFWLGFQRAA